MDLNLNNPEQIKQLIAALQMLLPKGEAEEEPMQDSKIRTKTSRSTNKVGKNLFSDMPEKNMHKADIEIDKKLNVHPPTVRNRKFQFVDVVCRTCGKKEKVSPAIVPESVDRYRCNKCSSSAGV
jgi:hypothetical protein